MYLKRTKQVILAAKYLQDRKCNEHNLIFVAVELVSVSSHITAYWLVQQLCHTICYTIIAVKNQSCKK